MTHILAHSRAFVHDNVCDISIFFFYLRSVCIISLFLCDIKRKPLVTHIAHDMTNRWQPHCRWCWTNNNKKLITHIICPEARLSMTFSHLRRAINNFRRTHQLLWPQNRNNNRKKEKHITKQKQRKLIIECIDHRFVTQQIVVWPRRKWHA